MASAPVRGRLAPSPTGYLHLGNAWAFLLAWLACRQARGTLVLRMENLDPERTSDSYAAGIIRDLHWLGLDWDEGPDVGGAKGPYTQGERGDLYGLALKRLADEGRVYPCYCTRGELRRQLAMVAGAPHVDDRGAPYPGTCRRLSPQEREARERTGRHGSLRLNTQGLPEYTFHDALHGKIRMSLEECGGDFVLRRADGVWAYQLAVTVDDGLMGVNQVVRGEDILVSTPRQLALFDLLGFPRPFYAHIPLLCNAAGERLAKRHQSLSLDSMRASGWLPEQIIGLLAWKAGMIPEARHLRPGELIPLFDWKRLPASPVVVDIC